MYGGYYCLIKKGYIMEELNFKKTFYQDDLLFSVLPLLLKDQTTGKNIVWATDSYLKYNDTFLKENQMKTLSVIDLINDSILVPRVQKSKEEQKLRTKKKAEVFTPSWLCNQMNNYCDSEWFGRKNVFNTENDDHTWDAYDNQIYFTKGTWQEYVNSTRLEITCGEAPFLVSRYDTTTGEIIPIEKRIGMLDRKMRIVNENTTSRDSWIDWTLQAFKSTYGFEYQGDNLFFARVNFIQTFIDYYVERFNQKPKTVLLFCITEIVSWNLWQMDGLLDCVPLNPEKYCQIKDWNTNRTFEFRKMKGIKL